MTIYLTSDLHLGHKRILEFCPESRKCETIEAHDELIIKNWNEQVKSTDTVYLLGDVSWHQHDKTVEILNRLPGHKNLILGNHDRNITGDAYKKIFTDIRHYREVKIDGIDVILCHYPIARWNKCHYGSIHLFGHEHGNFVNDGKSMDVGIDTRPNGDMKLWSWEEVHEKLKDIPAIQHH